MRAICRSTFMPRTIRDLLCRQIPKCSCLISGKISALLFLPQLPKITFPFNFCIFQPWQRQILRAVPVHINESTNASTRPDAALCASTVPGYSFVRKRWGLLLADKFSPIVWNKNAFDHLVLPAGIKELIHSLVRADRHNTDMIKDVIAGKGGDCILVLHGRPGTGKTLTAEAVAEQEKPLLNISVGDLGTDASQLESKLTEFFELASLWDAVLLVDEADIFMEARSLHELKRNAMVGVFLRVLEYQQQIMFLSTNRLNTFDEAFRSRISVAIQYRDLDESARQIVWENFLKVAEVKILSHIPDDGAPVAYVTTEQLDRLASKTLNGREIKNTMRTAQALANSSGKRLGYELLLNVLELVEQFDVADK